MRNFPIVISPRQLRRWLIENNISVNVTNPIIASDWDYTTQCNRDDASLNQVLSSAGMSEQDKDRAFAEASLLPE